MPLFRTDKGVLINCLLGLAVLSSTLVLGRETKIEKKNNLRMKRKKNNIKNNFISILLLALFLKTN